MDQIIINLDGDKLLFSGRLTESQVAAVNAMYSKQMDAESFLAIGIKMDISPNASSEQVNIKGRLLDFSCDLPERQAAALRMDDNLEILKDFKDSIVKDIEKILGLYELQRNAV